MMLYMQEKKKDLGTPKKRPEETKKTWYWMRLFPFSLKEFHLLIRESEIK